jgi:hypothetical protein
LYDTVNATLAEYFSFIKEKGIAIDDKIEDDVLDILSFQILNAAMQESLVFRTTEKILVAIAVNLKKQCKGLRIGFDILNSKQEIIFRSFHDDINNDDLEAGIVTVIGTIPDNILSEDNYYVSLQVGIHNQRWVVSENIYLSIDVKNIDGVNKLYSDFRPGVILPKIDWNLKK